MSDVGTVLTTLLWNSLVSSCCQEFTLAPKVIAIFAVAHCQCICWFTDQKDFEKGITVYAVHLCICSMAGLFRAGYRVLLCLRSNRRERIVRMADTGL